MKFFRKLLLFSLIFLASIVFVGSRPNPPRRELPISPLPSTTPLVFNFVVLSDIHSDLPNLQKALDKIKEDKMDFIIIVGDLTTLGKTEELIKVKTVLDKSGIVYYAIPGNHDLWSAKKQKNPFREVFGPDFQVFQKGKVKFILVNNGDEVEEVEGMVGIDGLGQREWLERELGDCPKLYCLVFMHLPLNNPVVKHVMGEDNPAVASQAAQLVKELVDYQVKELFAGHVHYLSTYILNGLKTSTDGVILDNPRFLEVTVTQPEVQLEEKQVWLK